VSIRIKQITRLVILASAAPALVGCEWITRVDSTGYSRVAGKDGKELFCKNVGAGSGGSDCYTRRQLWDIQNQNQNPVTVPWAEPGIGGGMYPTAGNMR
jgi:hypothetical protein